MKYIKNLYKGIKILIPYITITFPTIILGAGEGNLDSFFQNLNEYIVKTIGPAITILGILIAGIFLALGKKEGVRRGVYAVMGGVVITISAWFFEMIKTWVR